MVTLDKATHTYTELVNGFPIYVPSLSDVLRAGGVHTDFSKIDPTVLERKARIGEAFHMCVELWHAGQLDESTIDEAVEPYWEQFRLYRVADNIWPDAAVEIPVGGLETGYACTPDYVDAVKIVEWKTTSRLYPSVWVQLAGQARALGKMDLERFAVLVRPDRPPIVKRDKEPAYHDVVLASAYNIFQWKKENRIAA